MIITSECLCRTLFFKIGDACGTCFSYEKNGKQFLITAKHIFEKYKYPNKITISFFIKSNMVEYSTNIYYHTNKNVDIAIMKIEKENLTKTFNGPMYSTKGLIWGQDVYFLGYPYEFNNMIRPIEENSIPFIKKACMSGMVEENGINYILLDGINNEGFSGGPVCFSNNENKFSIAGVIKSFYVEKGFFKQDNKTISNEIYVSMNSGIIYATDIKYAIEIIDSILNLN